MTPMVHLLLLPFLFSIAVGENLEEKKGPFENLELEIPEGTPVPYPVYQFQVAQSEVNDFRLSGEGRNNIRISKDGWLYLEKALDWSQDNHFVFMVEALKNDVVLDGPIVVTIHVLDINNNAPTFNQSSYTTLVRENNPAGVPFAQVFASDLDDPESPNAQLSFSLVSQIPNNHNILLFQIDPNTGEISTTAEGEKMMKSREGIQYARGEDRSIEALKGKFDEFCPAPNVPYEENPFFTCVERAEIRRRNKDPLEDPDYTLIVRVQDQKGASPTALSGSTRVHIAVLQNRWINPGPITIQENLKGSYPQIIAKVQSNDPDAIYSLVQKEREPKFPFQITEEGDILVTEELDREEKDMYILVVFAKNTDDNEVDPPMEIQVIVEDVNDNKPECDAEQNVFEVQENEPVGSEIGTFVAHDSDKEGTLNSQLTYTIVSLNPPSASNVFSIDEASGKIQALRMLQRKEQRVYDLTIRVNDSVFSTVCSAVIKVIDVNNEMPLFEKNDYGKHSLSEDAPVGHTVLTIRASDADDPDSGSSLIEFHISAGDDDEVFTVQTDGTGVGHLVIAKPLDFESSPTYNLQIDARNPEPLMKGLEYGAESTTKVFLTVDDVDEVPEFSSDILDVTVPENIKRGSVLLTVKAKDPEGKEIGFKMDGDTKGWLEIDASTGEVKTKNKLDRETLESLEVTVTAFEKENPGKSSERVLHIQLLDVNDNTPELTENQAFICTKDPKPLILKAEDRDNDPYSQPFTFTLIEKAKSPIWELAKVDGKSAKLSLKRRVDEDKTFHLSINIKDNAGLWVNNAFRVRVCNCTELGSCYIPPDGASFKMGIGGTIGILAGVVIFCVLTFIIVIKRSNKKRKQDELDEEQHRNTLIQS